MQSNLYLIRDKNKKKRNEKANKQNILPLICGCPDVTELHIECIHSFIIHLSLVAFPNECAYYTAIKMDLGALPPHFNNQLKLHLFRL